MRVLLAVVFAVSMAGCADLATTLADGEPSRVGQNAPLTNTYCEAHTREAHAQDASLARREAMEAEIDDYLRLAEEALGMRASVIGLYQALKAKTGRGLPLSGSDLKQLNEGASQLLAQRLALLKVAEAHECWLEKNHAGDDREAGIRATGIVMSLSAALILYDNYLSAIAPFRRDHEFRRHLNRSDRGFDLPAGILDEMAVNFASVDNRRRTLRAIDWVDKHARSFQPEPFERYAYLLDSIEQSPSLQMVRRFQPLRDVGQSLGFFSTQTVDMLFTLKNESTNLSSLLFGNVVGLVETRHGKLYGRPEVAQRLAETLKAGDILLEKTPFRLTDKFIPGYWGHAAIWVGGEAELRALGIWDHPVVRPHQAAIRSGRGVVEALRSGVQMNTMAHFLNIDDLAVIRHTGLSTPQAAEAVLQALRQVGKAYDFNFDAETTHRVFCSKLVYLVYGDMKWPTSRMLGRVTVVPDDVAALVSEDGPLRVIRLFHNGDEVIEQPQKTMAQLIGAERTALARRENERRMAAD
ncbi:MAG TPA: YiiX/YebB-like N1pC/P60 family cysteine hydrolase [Accumulibacter sp.]|mgnify:CR=1 FL=1|jgi:hypothetical protein|nr:YiiX/YebB-like N1pC/P60 family cysteine hydrolase [Accumulibacter sp.]HQC79649.1 YiiX/YebB-like N1pC/P60 family cysteine hydrolase [Accumulibacter sp.]